MLQSITPSQEPKNADPSRAATIGVLLVNLGTPEGTDYRSVRRYLKEFLSDRRVIEVNRALWWVILNGVILTVRPGRKGRDYAKIWNREQDESPLRTITRTQAEKLAELLSDTPSVRVDWAMRYGVPSIRSRIKALQADGCDRILVVPLYPQYAAATSATVCDKVFEVLAQMRFQPALRVAPPYYADPVYIDAVARSIEETLSGLSFAPEVVLASFHGMPKSYVLKGDPYEAQCIRTTELLRERLGMDATKLRLTFQSRFGREEWLRPYTDETVMALARDRIRNLVVVTPGFSADCLETLEEIAGENAEYFHQSGGKNFAAVPCLNASAGGMRTIESVARRELAGWV